MATHRRHGMSYSKVYKVWRGMHDRCTNPNHVSWARYGARGITVCEAWSDFEVFYADMGEPNGLTLERKNNDLGYSKENCMWATRQTQNNNRIDTRRFEFAGKSLNLAQWSKLTGLRYNCIDYRLKNGWSIERALTTPSGART